MPDERPLRPKHARFVAEYLIDLNATQAAIRAGYSAKTAEQQGPRLLGNVGIQAGIQAGRSRQAASADLSAWRVLEELRCLGFSDLGAVFDDDGNLRPIRSLPREVRAAIASVKVVKKNLTAGDGATEWVHEVKLWDKVKVLDLLAKHFGLITEQLDVTVRGEVALVAILQAARQRLNGDTSQS